VCSEEAQAASLHARLPNRSGGRICGEKNGELLSLAEASGFEVFLSLDQGIEFEQNFRGRKLRVLLIRAKSSRLQDLIAYVPGILLAIEGIPPGHLIHIPQ
jgi:hypothetical protein